MKGKTDVVIVTGGSGMIELLIIAPFIFKRKIKEKYGLWDKYVV